jgi:protein gp37
MFIRKPWWWWDWGWNPVSGCKPRIASPGCGNCFVPQWFKSHPHKRETVDDGVTKEVGRHKRRVWNGEINTLPDGDPLWTFPLTWPGVENPALGPGRPSLIFVVVKGDLFYTKRVKEDIASINLICATIAASKHIGLLATKYTEEMAAYFAAIDPRTAKLWQRKLWLCFSAENQECFDKRWADIRPLAEAGWFVFVSIAPMLAPVALPDDFLALAKWVIVNGEEQVKRERCRPMKTAWVRAILDQCAAANIPLFIKGPHVGGYLAPDLQKIRQFPTVP